jgi:TRAP transporter 4TM/12TM fusion protein
MSQEKLTTPKSVAERITDALVMIIVCVTALFHLWTASFAVYPAYFLSAAHWAMVGCFIILKHPLKFKGGKIIDMVLFAANIFMCVHVILLQQAFVLKAGVYSQGDIYISIASLVIALLIAVRVVGMILPVISILFVLYGLYGRYFPGMFRTVRFTLRRLAPYLYTSADGIFGQTLMVSAQFIYLFVLFGSLLELTGAGEFFVDLAYSVTGKIRGGPAQAAVFSSMLMGTINGSGAANVVTTGNFTIPLMKKSGFSPERAGAIEAVASSGGQIMPPVMGAVAFLMAEMTGISYGKIAIAAFIPAVLYYVTLSVSVYFNARKEHVPFSSGGKILKTWEVLKSGWLYLGPLAVLIALLVMGFSAQRAVFVAILAVIGIGFIKNRKNMTPQKIYQSMVSSINGIAPIAAACLLAGIIMGIVNMTGLGLKISGIIQMLANGRLLVALLLSMITSLILGMGLPTSAAYMILAVLVAPALITMGAIPMAAHMFILYFGALSTITPPVALSIFAAAAIAGSNIWSTGKEAVKLAATGFVIPFIFVYNNELLMIGSIGAIVLALITAVLGCVVVSMSLTGWAAVKLSIPGRIVLFPCGIMLFIANPFFWNVIGLFAAVIMVLIEIKVIEPWREKRSEKRRGA